MHIETANRLAKFDSEKAVRRHVCPRATCTRIEEETRMAITGASDVHRALCAPDSQRAGMYENSSRVIPARHVGGDFVCTFQQGKGTFAVLGDLLGKGIAAAMWITHIVDLVHRAGEESKNAGELLERLNAEILMSRVSAPLTSAIAICMDHDTRQISCSSAGHPPAVLVRSNARAETIQEGGPIMGVFQNARYTYRTLELGSGDAVVAFSDGVIEAHSETGEEFTMERAMAVLSESNRFSAVEKSNALLDATMDFGTEEQFDDVSLLVVQRG